MDLLNVSNKTSKRWGKHQRGGFDRVVDVVPPKNDPDELPLVIYHQAIEILRAIVRRYPGRDANVSVEGDYCLQHTLVTLLQTQGFRCLYAVRRSEVRKYKRAVEGERLVKTFVGWRVVTSPLRPADELLLPPRSKGEPWTNDPWRELHYHQELYRTIKGTEAFAIN